MRLDVRSDTLRYGQSHRFSAQVSDADGTPLAAPVTWTSTDTTVATVSAGTVTAVGFGVARIVAGCGAAADTATVVVTSDGLSLQLTPSAVAASAGDTVAFQARLVAEGGSSMAVSHVQWTSSNAAVGEALGDGRVALRAAGDVEVIATVGDVSASAAVAVAPPPVGSIAITPAVDIDRGERVGAPGGGGDRSQRPRACLAGRRVAGVEPVGGDDRWVGHRDRREPGRRRRHRLVRRAERHRDSQRGVAARGEPHAGVAHDTVVPGFPMQAVATPRDAAGAPVAGRPIAWQSSNPTVATVNNTGVVVPLVAGLTNISAISDGHVATVLLHVENRRIASVAIVPGAPVVTVGSTVPLTAVVQDQMGNDVAGASVAWASQSPGVASVTGSGLLTGVAYGTSIVSAMAGGITASVTATVGSQPVASVQVAPATVSVPVGATVALAATARGAAGESIGGAAFTWSSSDGAVATVSALGIVTAQATGSAVVTAASGGVSASAAVTVTAPPPVPVASVSVALGATSLAVGQVTQAVATLADAQGNVLTGRPVTWASADPTIASISSGGLVTATGAGSVSISATAGGQTGFAAIGVSAPPPAPPAPVASVSVTAPATALHVGQSTQLAVTLRSAQGALLTGRTLLFSSSNTTIATVSPTGLVAAKAPGVAAVTVTSEGVSGGMAFTVSAVPPPPPTLTAVVLSPASVSLAVGATAQFAVTGSWSDGTSGVPLVTYAATGGTITAGGLYTAGATPGSYRVIATQQGGSKADTSSVIITAPVVTLLQVLLTPASVTLAPGDTARFSVAGVWSDGSSAVPAVTYSATGGTISVGGLYTAGATAGSYRVIAVEQGGTQADTSSVSIAVGSTPAALVEISPKSVSVLAGQTVQLVATVRDANGSVLVGRAVSWASTNPQLASVSASGLVTALAAGDVLVSATSEGRTSTATLVQVAGFYEGFESGTIASLFAVGCCTYSATIEQAISRSGRSAARVELRATDPITGASERSELRVTDGTIVGGAGSERWYGLSIYIPSTWRVDTNSQDFQILEQWNAIPDFELGEDWRSPPLSIWINKGQWSIWSYWDPAPITRLTDGIPAAPGGRAVLWSGAFESGRWTDWVVHAKWSYESDGFLEIWKDGQLVVSHHGPNTYNDRRPLYFMAGIYKWMWATPGLNWSELTRVAYFDELRIAGPSSGYGGVVPR